MASKILLLEEDNALREEISSLLVGRGYRVRAIGDVPAAVRALAERRYDLLVVHLTDGNRGALAGPVHRAAEHARVLVVADVERDVAVLARLVSELGAHAGVFHPCSPGELLVQVDQALVSWPLRPKARAVGDLQFGMSGAPLARVALVDANPARAVAVARIGASRRLRVVSGADVDEAFARAGVLPPDGALVTYDPRRPDAFVDIARRVRVRRGLERLPIAVMHPPSASPDPAALVHAGITRAIVTPPTAADLAEVARHFVAVGHKEPPAVLVVTANKGLALELARLFEGFRVTLLDAPARVLSTLDEVQPDSIVIDMEIPLVGGLSVCRAIRAVSGGSDLPVLMVTGRAGVEARLAAIEAGADDVLAGTIVREEIVARVQQRVERGRVLRERSARDGLTGLPLRRRFTDDVGARLVEARRDGHSLCVGLLDIDHFKRVNDTWGHLAGDRVLVELGRLFALRFRAQDVRGRWGGEEFALALPDVTVDRAVAVLARALGEFRALPFESDDGEVFGATFSAGVACFPHDGDDLGALMRVADARLYRAKAEGRCRIVGR